MQTRWADPSPRGGCLIQSTNLLLKGPQVIHWIEHHVGFRLRPNMPCNDLGPAADDYFMDIAADLYFVVSEGDRYRVVVVAVANHRD